MTRAQANVSVETNTEMHTETQAILPKRLLQITEDKVMQRQTVAPEQARRTADTLNSKILQHRWADVDNRVLDMAETLPEMAEELTDIDHLEMANTATNRLDDLVEATQEAQEAQAPMAEESSPWMTPTTA